MWTPARSIAIRLIVVNSIAWAPAIGWAHPEFNPVSTNSYAKFNLRSRPGGAELRLAYTVMYGARPAAIARRSADANGDGRLDEAETRTLGEVLRASALAGLSLTVDGRTVGLRFEPPAVGLMGTAVGESPFSVDLIANVPCPGAPPHEVRFDDRTLLPALGESEVRIEEAPGIELLAASRGTPTPGERRTQFQFRGPRLSALEDRSITFRFAGASSRAPGAAPERPALLRVTAVAAAAALLLVLALIWVSRKKR